MISEETLTKVDQACAGLVALEQVVTFAEVARRAKVTRNSLYRNPELRQMVEGYRTISKRSHTFIELSAQVEELRGLIDAVATKVRHHEEQIRHLNQSVGNKPHGSGAAHSSGSGLAG
ncbi:hypothetical protein [Ferrimicrobium sp.]|uniref:hypothetical protein n=2 Tax=Ferrimicrobium TaxID=121038 RepID=UPI00261AA11B|nr:hypothetical protein [Ferrimicrobium sp.]